MNKLDKLLKSENTDDVKIGLTLVISQIQECNDLQEYIQSFQQATDIGEETIKISRPSANDEWDDLMWASYKAIKSNLGERGYKIYIDWGLTDNDPGWLVLKYWRRA